MISPPLETKTIVCVSRGFPCLFQSHVYPLDLSMPPIPLRRCCTSPQLEGSTTVFFGILRLRLPRRCGGRCVSGHCAVLLILLEFHLFGIRGSRVTLAPFTTFLTQTWKLRSPMSNSLRQLAEDFRSIRASGRCERGNKICRGNE